MDNPSSVTTTLDAAAFDVDTSDGGRRRILHPVTLNLPEHRIAVIGANGSGKSTLLRLIAGLVAPSSGSVQLSPAGVRTGFIFANPQAQLIMPVVGEDIAFSLRSSITSAAQRRQRSREILDTMGLGDREESSIYDLSSGERQKVALAGVLAAEPELVLADEPTTLLDLRSTVEFTQMLMNLTPPMIVATHDLGLAARAQRVLVFDHGHLVADGPPGVAIPYYRELAGADGPASSAPER
ncbi:energy-coupling factor ABC transporter ATP-binding protein [Nesterenkonia halotolerans]|uniref:Biotin transport system ATP-binding protein n=1 Tax=Nesterenkonia halotolerans TaxID=225325 RepID=A0ABR9J4E1_9MICC|nr:ABC transporter ATP-binding protein [Nesterenkonia halotolerans]MBE1513461.1 biotin transport system ATP-binding protein [Nesterenkonia halotolerans]